MNEISRVDLENILTNRFVIQSDLINANVLDISLFTNLLPSVLSRRKDSPFLFYYLPAISQIIYFTCSAMGFNCRKRFLRSPISATTLVLWRWYARISRPIRTSSDVSHVNHTCLHSTKGNTWIATVWMFQYIAVILFFLWNADISSEMSEEEKSRCDTIGIHESLKVSFADTCLL